MDLTSFPTELLASLGIGGTLLVIFAFNLIKNYFQSKADTAVSNAESFLYNNLVAENKRMSDMLTLISEKMNTLQFENSTLLARVGELERSIQRLAVWEQEAKTLQLEMVNKDKLIAELNVKIAEQLLIINKINGRSTDIIPKE